MRRMISQKLQDLLKKLSQSIWTDESGDVEIGKNLEVDGEATINTKLTSVDNSFNRVTIPTLNAIRTPNNSGGYDALGNTLDATYSKTKYQHTITLQANAESVYFCFTCYLSKNTPIESVQDLTTLLGGASYSGCGSYIYDGDMLTLMRIIVGSAISGSSLVDVENNGHSFSQLTGIFIKDDVSIPR